MTTNGDNIDGSTALIRAAALPEAEHLSAQSDFSFINANKDRDSLCSHAEIERLVRESPSQRLVLVAEDNPEVRDLLCFTLTKQGYAVLEFPDGESALDAFARHKHEHPILVLDECIPRLCGSDVARKAKELDPNVPIILTSGYCYDDFRPPITIDQQRRFLEKPYKIERLLGLMRELSAPARLA